MFLFSCGRESLEASDAPPPPPPPLKRPPPARASYETFAQKQASASSKEPRQRARLKNEDIWSHSASDEYDDERLAPSGTTLGALVPSSYEGAAAQVRPLGAEPLSAGRGCEPALWSLARPRQTQRSSSSAGSDEIPVPELHVGVYQSFCPPQLWSPAFASPGDFTVKMASVSRRDGDVSFQLAVICSCVRAVRDGARVNDAARRRAFVKHVRRSQRELARFADAMALRLVGHGLAAALPRSAPLPLGAWRDQRALEALGEAVVLFLARLLAVADVGFHGLVPLAAPVAKHLLVREFLMPVDAVLLRQAHLSPHSREDGVNLCRSFQKLDRDQSGAITLCE